MCLTDVTLCGHEDEHVAVIGFNQHILHRADRRIDV